MKKIIKSGVIIAICIVAVGVMWTQSHSKESVLEVTKENTSDKTETDEEIVFPERFEKNVSDTFSIQADVIVPDAFDAQQLYTAEAHIIKPDEEKWKAAFLNGTDYVESDYEEVSREQKNIVCKGYEKEGDRALYLSEQAASLYLDKYTYTSNCLIWDYSTSEGYNRDNFSTDENLPFAEKEEVWKSINEKLETLDIPMENAFTEKVYALPYQSLQEQELLAVERGDLDREETKDIWNEKDDAYFFYIWQNCQGLPVYPDGYVQEYDVENIPGGIEVCCTEEDFLFLNVSYWMEFEKSAEKIKLLSLDKIMDTVIEKYGQVINDSPMTLTSCRLFEAPILKEENTYEVVPVWICKIELEEMSYDMYLPIHAVTGEIVKEMELR
ncbi:MAG: hypothetical protein J6A92_05605 [Lachnospiraceae bacterium]|nr:hypothetical protein [Lachnospiraceae bacterium]